jgi:PIN domain nuclease of toxin-antitoxin system
MRSAEPILLDTHVVLWWKAGGERLSAPARSAIDAATEVLISALSCWEIAMLVAKGRVALDRPIGEWVADLLAGERLALAPLSPSAAVAAAGLLDFHGDPVDRLLVATAAELAVPLVTKDRKIAEHAASRGGPTVIW